MEQTKTMQARQHGDDGGLSATTGHTTGHKSVKAASPIPPVGGFSAGQVSYLIAAGRLIQNKKWPWGKRKINRLAGEAYPQAVFRTVTFELDGKERQHLRELVAWVRDYEREEGRQAE